MVDLIILNSDKLPNFDPNKLLYLYGPQRFASLFESKTEDPNNPAFCLPDWMCKKDDEFLLQATSLGTNFTADFVEQLARNYMGTSDRNPEKENVQWSTENCHIIWPSENFMHSCAEDAALRRNKVVTHISKSGYGGTCFWSPTMFSKTSDVCLERFFTYNPAKGVYVDGQGNSQKYMPHIKTYGRVVNNETLKNCFLKPTYQNKTNREEEKPTAFSWFMLTSACLSRGAQGYFLQDRPEKSDNMAYSNFELGVVFTSKLATKPNVLYTCGGGEGDGGQWKDDEFEIIKLPVPYTLSGKQYCPADDTSFYPMPFFHDHESIKQLSKCRILPLHELADEKSTDEWGRSGGLAVRDDENSADNISATLAGPNIQDAIELAHVAKDSDVLQELLLGVKRTEGNPYV